MKKITFILLSALQFNFLHAQQVINLQENTPYEYNGLSYGYYITNSASKEVKGEDYDRYELTLYATNKSGSMKLISFAALGNNADQDEIVIADFSCKNATGKRLTSKFGQVKIKPWFTQVKIPDEAQPTKFKMINAQVGYALLNGQTANTRIIVIVPKGQMPEVTLRPAYFPNS